MSDIAAPAKNNRQLLREYCQQHKLSYNDTNKNTGSEHRPLWTVECFVDHRPVGKGSATTVANAEEIAAGEALAELLSRTTDEAKDDEGIIRGRELLPIPSWAELNSDVAVLRLQVDKLKAEMAWQDMEMKRFKNLWMDTKGQVELQNMLMQELNAPPPPWMVPHLGPPMLIEPHPLPPNRVRAPRPRKPRAQYNNNRNTNVGNPPRNY